MCSKTAGGCSHSCDQCQADKAGCQWVTDPPSDVEEGGSISRTINTSTCHRSHPSVEVLQDIVAAIHEVQQGHEEHLCQVEDQSLHALEAMEHLVRVFVSGGVERVAERVEAPTEAAGGSGSGTSLLGDYDSEGSSLGL